MQGLLAELKRIERQQSILQDAVQNSKTVIAHPRITPPVTPEKPKEPEDKFIASGEKLPAEGAEQEAQQACTACLVTGNQGL